MLSDRPFLVSEVIFLYRIRLGYYSFSESLIDVLYLALRVANEFKSPEAVC